MAVTHSPTEAPRALDRARRRTRTTKPPDERRREIISAAAELFRLNGFDSTSVQSIAARAGVAAGTVYLYFSSKDAVLSAIAEEFEAGLVERFGAISEEVLAEEDASGQIVSYDQAVERLVDALVAYCLENRAVSEVLARHLGRLTAWPHSPILAGELTNLLTNVIADAERLGYVKTTDPQMTAYLLMTALTTAIGNAITYDDEDMLTRVVNQAKEMFVKVLAPG